MRTETARLAFTMGTMVIAVETHDTDGWVVTARMEATDGYNVLVETTWRAQRAQAFARAEILEIQWRAQRVRDAALAFDRVS